MKMHIKPLVALGCGAILLTVMPCQTATAQTVLSSGTTYLIDVFGDAPTSPNGMNEDLPVAYSVTQSGAIFTYNYTIYNPSGDVLQSSSGVPTTDPGTPEIVNNLTIDFNESPSSVLSITPIAGYSSIPLPGAGITWSFPAVTPGNNSAEMSFTSPFGPTMGPASAQNGDGPSPWSGSLPVPAPEPATTSLLALMGLSLLPFRSILKRKVSLA